MSYTLAVDGDSFEQHYWAKFLATSFPSYESFWVNRIVPLTHRPTNIHFKDSATLTSLGFNSEDVCIAQLHYTILRHLARAYEILNLLTSSAQDVGSTELLSEGLFHVCGAQDVAFEFLQRNKTPGVYDPWAPTKHHSSTGTQGSKEAKTQWQKDNSYPLQDIRDYRNHLIHGRMSPSTFNGSKVYLPEIGVENNYLDWRVITDGYIGTPADFKSLDEIMNKAWTETLSYLETEWRSL